MTRKLPLARILGYGLIAIGLLETLGINLFTLHQIWRARTDVPWWDEWALVQDLMQIKRGHALWSVLWSPYWGERQVVTRLLWLANAHLNSLASLTWLTLLLQFVHIAVLIWLAHLLLVRTGEGNAVSKTRTVGSRASFLIACAVILNLMLSPFQMWNFAWSTQVMFILSFLLATTSFVTLALAAQRRSRLFVALAAALAILGTLTMPNGLLVWPVLILQSLYMKMSRRAVSSLGLMGVAAFFSYFWQYSRPDIGMGIGGMVRHPIQAVLLTGVVVAGPIGSISNPLAAVVGVSAIFATGYLSARALRQDGVRHLLSAIVGVLFFLILSACSVVAGRLDARFLARNPAYSVPFRYPTLVSAFWTCIALLVLYTCWHAEVRPVLLALAGAPLFYFMFFTVRQQIVMAEDWSDYFRGVDAVGAALLLDAPDEELLAHLWPIRAEREQRVAFLRERRLAMFGEPRALWIGKRVSGLFPSDQGEKCIGEIEKVVDLSGFARVEGWAWEPGRGRTPDYILFADSAGKIIGQARGGLRHGYIPGLLATKGTVPVSHAQFRHSEWLGYLLEADGMPREQITIVGVFQGEAKSVLCSNPE